MEVVFVGTGGGRFNLIRQVRSTAGFRIHGSQRIYIDPGPGSLLRSQQFKQDVSKTDILFVSHAHIDHSHDASLVIEAMTDFTFKKRGTVFGSENVLVGSERFDRVVSRYHQSKVERCEVVKAGGRVQAGSAFFELTPTKHDEWTGVGFILSMDGMKIGYTSDTEYFPGLGKIFYGVDLLVINNLKPRRDGIPDHLSSEDTVKILEGAKPGKAVITHLGMEFVRRPAEVEAQWIREETGVETLAARDGMVLELGERKKKEGLARFE